MNIDEITNPLVSIIVITYNSSQFVIETLESAKSQTYENIELIVSDDCSTDNTVELCKKWIESNKERFYRTELITICKNSGVSSNCNRSLKKANGIWIKYVAGDDLLNANCINRFLHTAMNDNQNNSFIFCNKSIFNDYSKEVRSEKISNLLDKSHKKQLVKYACTRPTIAPFMFVKKDTLLKLNGFDETYRLLEDSPLYFKALKNNYFFQLVDEDLVYYRLSATSISNSPTPNAIFSHELKTFTNYNIIPFLFSKGLVFNSLKLNIEYNTSFKTLRFFFLKVLNKLAQIERKVLYFI